MARSKKTKKTKSYRHHKKKRTTRRTHAKQSLYSKRRSYYKSVAQKTIEPDPEFDFQKVAQVQNKYIPFNFQIYYSKQLDQIRVKTCRRRLQRPQVLHALNKIGSGKKVKKPNYDNRSNIKC